MFSPNKNNSPLSSSFEQPVYQNHKQIRNIQSKYFNDEYQKSIQQKQSKIQQQKQKKKLELDQYIKKNEEYLNNVAMNRYNRLQQKQFMAEQYEEMINNRKMKEQQQKRQQKSFERDLLGQRSWIRDVNQQRQINKMKVNRYSEQLEMHVKAQQQRVKQEQELQKQVREKINQQAQMILNKQIQQLQERQRRKNMFEQRQNDLLGANNNVNQGYQATQYGTESGVGTNYQVSNGNSLSNSKVMEEISMRKRQQELYGAGLEIQRQAQQQRKRKEFEQGYQPGESYNPITNPIPVVYKNPNVLRMLSQK